MTALFTFSKAETQKSLETAVVVSKCLQASEFLFSQYTSYNFTISEPKVQLKFLFIDKP